jgi:DNA-binding SARP family transcriptional activator
MDFRLLGPLEVSDRDTALALGGIQQRSLLAILLLQANELVSTEALIDRLWAATPPATAVKTVHVHVSRLRKLLGEEGRLVTHGRGYVLHLDPSELDLARFELLADEARRSTPAVAARKLAEALALWRGPALADLAYESLPRSRSPGSRRCA